MRHGFTCVIAAAVLVAAPMAAAAQVSASPRTVDGRPNLQGIWQVLNTAAWDIQDHPARLGVPAGQGVVDRGVRTIYTDGTPHPEGSINWWMGDSRGRWEGNTLVVDVVHFTDQTWFDRAGNFHSDGLHLVERFTPAGPDHINYEVTVEDPAVFTRPWKMSMPFYRRKEANVRLLEYDPGLLLDQEQAERERRTTR